MLSEATRAFANDQLDIGLVDQDLAEDIMSLFPRLRLVKELVIDGERLLDVLATTPTPCAA